MGGMPVHFKVVGAHTFTHLVTSGAIFSRGRFLGGGRKQESPENLDMDMGRTFEAPLTVTQAVR